MMIIDVIVIVKCQYPIQKNEFEKICAKKPDFLFTNGEGEKNKEDKDAFALKSKKASYINI